MTRKIYVVGHQRAYASWMEGELVSDIQDADLVVFTGGEDIDPALYGKYPHKQTWFNRDRDKTEVEFFDYAKAEGRRSLVSVGEHS